MAFLFFLYFHTTSLISKADGKTGIHSFCINSNMCPIMFIALDLKTVLYKI
jgi:hypothetical protein